MDVQCGYEYNCKKKDCLNCPRKQTYKKLTLTQAEETVIEDFAVCNLLGMLKEQPDRMELEQSVMRKLMKKIFSKQDKNGKVK